ncbi:hypothetical protein E4U41_003769 [Claviceps citrina]|nr:hypothetical protein E4U41_003769 [Claviceps citrina]
MGVGDGSLIRRMRSKTSGVTKHAVEELISGARSSPRQKRLPVQHYQILFRHPIIFTLALRAFRLAGLAVGLGISAFTAYQRSQAAQMASGASRRGHLDAGAGREVVYCHACFNEWFRIDHGLACPRCGSDVTEIVSPENDPRRDLAPSSNSNSPDLPPLRPVDDSDPDEADIEEHMGPQGIRFRRSTRSGPEQQHHDPTLEPVLDSFYDMIQNFGQTAAPGRSGGTGIFGRANDETFVAPRIQRTTFTSGALGGGTASVTIFSSPAFRGPGNQGGEDRAGSDHDNEEAVDPFQALFTSIIREIPPPSAPGEQGRPTGPQPGIVRGLQDILNLFNPANAMMGDAVYSQEAFDSIITQLMEANPQSNAAPPASEEALGKLDRRPVDQQMLEPEGQVECSICIDDMEVGQTAVFLRCKHWFHEDCVVLWLKEHNTCPVCRTPIEKNNRAGNRSAAGGSSGSDRTPRGGNATRPPHPPPNFSRSNSDQPRAAGSGADTPTGRAAAEMVSSIYVGTHNRRSSQRLDEALQSVENMQRERDRDRDHDRAQGRAAAAAAAAAAASGFSYDTSRLQRRTSHSPTSPRTANLAEQGARMRQRSPSESSRRGNSDRDGRRQSGPGPWSWIRDRLTGSGNSGGPQDSHGQDQS